MIGRTTVLHEQWTLSGGILGKSEFYRALEEAIRKWHDWLKVRVSLYGWQVLFHGKLAKAELEDCDWHCFLEG